MKKVLIVLGLLVSCFCFMGHAQIGVYHYLPGTIAATQSANTAMVKVNIDGISKEAMIVVPYMKNNLPTIEVVTMTTSTLEYSYTFPAGTSRFLFRAVEDFPIWVSFTAGGTLANNYMPLYEREAYGQDNLFFRELTIYLRAATEEVTNVAIESWR